MTKNQPVTSLNQILYTTDWIGLGNNYPGVGGREFVIVKPELIVPCWRIH